MAWRYLDPPSIPDHVIRNFIIYELSCGAQIFASRYMLRSSYSETAFLLLREGTGMIGLRDQYVDFAPLRRYFLIPFSYFILARVREKGMIK
jgi:hypothetical protein